MQNAAGYPAASVGGFGRAASAGRLRPGGFGRAASAGNFSGQLRRADGRGPRERRRSSWPDAESCTARCGDVADVDLLEHQLMSMIFWVEGAQGLFVGAPRGWPVTESVVATAKSERGERERGVGVQRTAKRSRG